MTWHLQFKPWLNLYYFISSSLMADFTFPLPFRGFPSININKLQKSIKIIDLVASSFYGRVYK